jgi:PAS domain S-box-containing protein
MSTRGTQVASTASWDVVAGWQQPRTRAHSVQFYEDDDFLLDGLSRFIGGALLAGDSTIVVASKAHRNELTSRLIKGGLDLTAAITGGRFVSLDAAETLSKFMVDGRPDGKMFSRIVGKVMTQVGAASRAEHPRVAAFGEMVALLLAEGKRDAALQLEELWNELAKTHSFQLHCAYPMSFFSQERDGEILRALCSVHSHAVPTEGYTALVGDEERRRNVIFLQHKAQALETEIRERKRADQSRRESEERLQLAQQVAGIGTFEWNIAADVNRWTPQLETIYGLHPGQFAGTLEAWEELIHPDDRDEVLKLVEASYETNGPVQGEWRVVWPDGSVHWIAAKWQVFRELGKPLRMTGVNMDVTERKRAEEASLQLAAIVQFADDAIVSKDLNGIVTSWNRAAEITLGYRAEEIVGRSILLIIPPELHDEEARILAKIRAGEPIENFETLRLCKDGERLNVSLTISPIKDRTGKIVGAAKIIHNITLQKKLEANLRTSEKLAAVGRMAATIAHEMNNPLEAVTNLIYLARQDADQPDKNKKYLSAADKELRRASHIARQALGFCRDASQPAEFSVAKAVDDVLTIYESRFKNKALRIEKRIQRGLTVSTVQGEFMQVLSNLIANAIDASRKGGRILIRARGARHCKSGQAGIRITIADAGPGISPDNKKKIFTPFFTTKGEVGTGLGLWIVRDLLEKRHGSISFRSHNHTKSGTTMSFFVPMELAQSRLV